MMSDPSARDGRALTTIRRLLLATLLAGIAGTGGELLLLGHFESAAQWVPLVLLGLGLAAAFWQLAAPGAASVRALQLVATLFVAAGLVGVGLHYDGNAAFEREMYPDIAGMRLVRDALSGATPVLAPGSLTLLGLVAFAYSYDHPALRRDWPGPSEEAFR